MAAPSIKVEGAQDLQRALRQVQDGIADLKDVHKQAAELVVSDARPRARRKTGAMAASGRATGQAREGVVRFGFARLPYVPIQVFGNPKHNISPNPFIYEAMDARINDVYRVYEDGVDKVIKKNGLQ